MEHENSNVSEINAGAERALANLSASIDVNHRFPMKVFIGEWSGFYFFDSEWIFDAQFIEIARELLKIEGAQCACLVDLDMPTGLEESSFFIEGTVTSLEFQSFLSGSSTAAGVGWVHSVDRFGGTSDGGKWCIYCEKRNEIAVIAIRCNDAQEKYLPALAQFRALPIDQAISRPLSYGFTERALSSDWRDELLKQYKM